MTRLRNMNGAGILPALLVMVFMACNNPTGGDNPADDDKSYTEIPIPGEHDDTLAAALTWIRGNAVNWGAYTVTVKANEAIQKQSLSYNGKRVSITLKGNADNREVGLSGTGSLFTVGKGVTLTVENLMLQGMGNNADAANDRALVEVHGGGVFKLKAGAVITGNYTTKIHGGGVSVNENAAFTMEGGEISDNTASGGGGVSVNENAAFTMKGGEISGNTVTATGGDGKGHGGGVRVHENGTFIMKGGTISGNSASGVVAGEGGGVKLDRCTFIMENGTISDNSASGDSWSEGGGVHVWEATFTLKGGTISGNTAGNGGGVRVCGENATGTFTMEGGTISGNTASEWGGGGVSVNENAAFTMKGGEISGNTASEDGGGVGVWEGTFTMEGGTISGNTAGEWGGGGVGVGGNSTFTKKGGTIYGDNDTAHTPDSTENTASSGDGHAVQLAGGKGRNATAGAEVKLYAQYNGSTWTYTDPATGGVGDTTAEWE